MMNEIHFVIYLQEISISIDKCVGRSVWWGRRRECWNGIGRIGQREKPFHGDGEDDRSATAAAANAWHEYAATVVECQGAFVAVS